MLCVECKKNSTNGRFCKRCLNDAYDREDLLSTLGDEWIGSYGTPQ